MLTRLRWLLRPRYVGLETLRKLVGLLLLSFSWLVTFGVLWLFLTRPSGCLQCVLVVFPDHTYFLLHAKNKGTDQPAHPRSLISVFVFRSLQNVIYNLALYKYSFSILSETSKPPLDIFSYILSYMIRTWLKFTLNMEKSIKQNLSKFHFHKL